MGSGANRGVLEDHDGLRDRSVGSGSLAMETQSRWRLAAGSSAWRRFDDEAVVYHDATGSTHHVGPLASALLAALMEHRTGADVETLLHDLHDDGTIGADAALVVEVERTLCELARLELATREAA